MCPKGKYGATFGLQNSNCTGNCSPGYYCPEGSVSRYEIECSDPSYYCPNEGMFEPIKVDIGYYSISNLYFI